MLVFLAASLTYWLNVFSWFKMHPCFGLDEILRFLAYELVVSGARASAVALACSLKTIEEPVLDVLWETQDWLIPLLNRMSGRKKVDIL